MKLSESQLVSQMCKLYEEAESKAQQRFMGMVHAVQTGQMDPEDASPEVNKVAKTIKKKDAEDMASTKHKGLPNHVSEQEQKNYVYEQVKKSLEEGLTQDEILKEWGFPDGEDYDTQDGLEKKDLYFRLDDPSDPGRLIQSLESDLFNQFPGLDLEIEPVDDKNQEYKVTNLNEEDYDDVLNYLLDNYTEVMWKIGF